MDVAALQFLPERRYPLGVLDGAAHSLPQFGGIREGAGNRFVKLLLKLGETPQLPPERPGADALFAHPPPVGNGGRAVVAEAPAQEAPAAALPDFKLALGEP